MRAARIVIGGGLALLAAAQGVPAASPALEGRVQGEARTLFAITYRPGPAWRRGLPMERQGLRAHFLYWRDLHARRRVAIAGPLGVDGGLVLLRAANEAEARGVMAADPAVIAGVFVGEVRPFTPVFEGSSRP